MAGPLVSVIIPMFNAERFIESTMKSVREQSWRRLEIIVVDDGSTDSSADIVSSVSDERIILFRQDNKGQTSALNAGLARATGMFIQYLDADDLLDPRKIELQVARLTSAPNCLATCEWSRFQWSVSEAKFDPYPCWADSHPLDWFYADWIDGKSMMFPALWLVPASLARQAGPWNEALTLNNDAEYFTRLLLTCERVLFCPGARAYYRSGHPGSLSGLKSRAGWLSQYAVLQACQAKVMQVEDSERMRTLFSRAFQRMAYQCHPYARDLAAAAVSSAKELSSIRLEPEGGPSFRIVSRIFGWRAARTLQVWAGRR